MSDFFLSIFITVFKQHHLFVYHRVLNNTTENDYIKKDITDMDGLLCEKILVTKSLSTCNIDPPSFFRNSRLHNEKLCPSPLHPSNHSHGVLGREQHTFHSHCSARHPRSHRLPGAGGEDTEVEAVEPGVGDTISSLVLVKPMEVVIERVALPPISSTLWKMSNSPVNSSLILLQISELSGARIGTQFGCPLTTVVNCQYQKIKISNTNSMLFIIMIPYLHLVEELVKF